MVDTFGRAYVSNEELNKHALPIIGTKSWEVRFSIQFVQICAQINKYMNKYNVCMCVHTQTHTQIVCGDISS
jgi:hypothetical protein